MIRAFRRRSLALLGCLLLAGCGGGGGSVSTPAPTPAPTPTALYSVPGAEALSVTDVQQVIAQSVAEAAARGTPAVIAVTDRVGNVLAIYEMAGAPAMVKIQDGPSGPGADIGLQGAMVPVEAAAIAKAVTGAYLSSGGNAFSTRTASEIVQTTFPPGPVAVGLGSGPLYGVQFSSLPCSDLVQRYSAAAAAAASAFVGPKRTPLGLAADPGGFPLYKSGVLVGAVGVKTSLVYGLDPDTQAANPTQLGEEAVALAGTVGFDAPASIRADQISVGGTLLIYSNATTQTLMSNPAAAPGFASLPAGLKAVTGYYAGTAVLAGQVYGTEASGLRPATTAEFDNPDAFVLTDGSGADRYPIRAGSDAVASPLTAAEVQALLQQAFATMSQTRAQIRQPLNSRAEVTISVVDTNGTVLGVVRAPDAPIFGIDVSLQKARTAMFFSAPTAASDIAADPDVSAYLAAVRNFLGMPTAFTGATAFTARAIGDLERPTFPDGQVGGPNGPLSPDAAHFNPFDTGFQSDFIISNLGQHVTYVADHGTTADTPAVCGNIPGAGAKRLANGTQIFPGGEPIYRGGVLVGGIGVSGDGVNQDDLIGFLGADGAANQLHTIGNAAPAIRADQLVIAQGGPSNRLLYVQCPPSPFLNASVQDACSGK